MQTWTDFDFVLKASLYCELLPFFLVIVIVVPSTLLWDFYSEQHASVHYNLFIHSLGLLYITVTFKHGCVKSLSFIHIMISTS